MHFNCLRSTFFFKKQWLFFFGIFIISSCGNKKESTLLEVLEAIEQDNIASVSHLCTPEALEQIKMRKRTFQSMLINDWHLSYYHLKCSEGETVSRCALCDESESCTPIDYLKLRNTDGTWLVDYNQHSPTVVVEHFLGYLEKMDFEAARKIAGPKLRKELKAMESVITLLKDTEILKNQEFKKLRQDITHIASFNPELEWLKCNDDASYPQTKICFRCNPLYGQTNEAIRVTKMKDKKWYVEYYLE